MSENNFHRNHEVAAAVGRWCDEDDGDDDEKIPLNRHQLSHVQALSHTQMLLFFHGDMCLFVCLCVGPEMVVQFAGF